MLICVHQHHKVHSLCNDLNKFWFDCVDFSENNVTRVKIKSFYSLFIFTLNSIITGQNLFQDLAKCRQTHTNT